MANSMDGQNSVLSVVGPLATSVGALKLIIKSILATEPWLHDPLVAEIPWRDEQEQYILDLVKSNREGKGQLAFGIMRDDGVVRPQPPVRRALDIVVKTIEKLGHKIVEWNPPSHARAIELAVSCPFIQERPILRDYQAQTWIYDGGEDVHAAFKLSGEPMASQVASSYGTLRRQYTASQIAAVNVARRTYLKEYMDYCMHFFLSSLCGSFFMPEF